jgi:hypothetical protein
MEGNRRPHSYALTAVDDVPKRCRSTTSLGRRLAEQGLTSGVNGLGCLTDLARPHTCGYAEFGQAVTDNAAEINARRANLDGGRTSVRVFRAWP